MVMNNLVQFVCVRVSVGYYTKEDHGNQEGNKPDKRTPRSSAFSKTWLLPELWRLLSYESRAGAGCIPVFSTRGKGAPRPLLSALAGATKRETPTSNPTESTEEGHPSPSPTYAYPPPISATISFMK